jgi:hypothetical protein
MATPLTRTAPPLFLTKDPFGNPVSLSHSTWAHVILHKDMIGLERKVKLAVENPSRIYESRSHEDRLIFHAENLLAPRFNVVRVIVAYVDISGVTGGSTSGEVITAFTPLPTNEFSGNIGPMIYRRPKASKKKTSKKREAQ